MQKRSSLNEKFNGLVPALFTKHAGALRDLMAQAAKRKNLALGGVGIGGAAYHKSVVDSLRRAGEEATALANSRLGVAQNNSVLEKALSDAKANADFLQQKLNESIAGNHRMYQGIIDHRGALKRVIDGSGMSGVADPSALKQAIIDGADLLKKLPHQEYGF